VVVVARGEGVTRRAPRYFEMKNVGLPRRILGNPDLVDQEERDELIRRTLASMPWRMRTAIELRYGLDSRRKPRTLDEVGALADRAFTLATR